MRLNLFNSGLLLLVLGAHSPCGASDEGPVVFEVHERTIECGGMPIRVDRGSPDGYRVLDADGSQLLLDEALSIVGRELASAPVRWRLLEPLPIPDGHRTRAPLPAAILLPRRFGARPGFFAHPSALFRTSQGDYVVDTANHRIQVLDRAGVFRGRFGLHQIEPRQGAGRLHYPTDVHVTRDGLRALVAEPLEGRIQVFRARRDGDPPRDPAATWDRVDLPAHYGEHWALAGEWLLVSEPDAVRVALLRVRESGVPVRVSDLGGVPGSELGRFQRPREVDSLPAAEDGRARFLVHDPGSERVVLLAVDPLAGELRFDPRHLSVLGSIEVAPGAVIAAAGGDGGPPGLWEGSGAEIVRRDLRGERRGEPLPVGEGELLSLHSDPMSGDLVAILLRDGARRLLLFEAGDRVPKVLASSELAEAEPGSVAFAADGSLLVCCPRLHHLVRIDRTGRSLGTVGGPGIGAAEFHHPQAVRVDARGRIWVLDQGNHRGQVLDPQGRALLGFGSRAYLTELRRQLQERAGKESP